MEIFIPEARIGQRYKFEIRSRSGDIILKADPYAQQASVSPETDSIIADQPRHVWEDHAWIAHREKIDWQRAPLAIYEVHIGSWRYDEQGNQLSYRDMARPLIEHCQHCGFNAIEFLPLAHHPYEGSWGYQVTDNMRRIAVMDQG